MKENLLSTLFFRWLGPLFNLSLFWKVGVVIGSCVLVNTVIAHTFYNQLNELKDTVEDASIYDYKCLVHESTLLLERLKHLEKADPEFMLTVSSIRDLGWIGLRGGIYERDGEEIITITHPVKDPDIIWHLKKIRELTREPLSVGDNITSELSHELKTILRLSLQKEKEYREKLTFYSEKNAFLFMMLYVFLGIFLVWGGVAFFFMVKRPLDRIIDSLRRLLSEDEQFFCDERDHAFFSYYADDEIGQLSRAVNDVIRRYGEIACFKRLIEEDETLEDVLEHLAQVFEQRLGFSTFAIYQVSKSQNTMECIRLCPEDLEINPEKLVNANACRAKRTGHIVSSLSQPGVCKLFLWKDEAEHYCIPLMSGGHCVGIVQFITPKGYATRKQKRVLANLRLAKKFIDEAVPVLEAKRYAQSLKSQAIKDPLTGLFNRRFLSETLNNVVAGVLRRKTCIGILMADLDFFKSVNDEYGHDVGDGILKQTASIFTKNCRTADIICRYGGEEFLILLLDVREGESVKVAEKLRAAVEATRFETPHGVITRTISIGVSEFPVDTEAIWEAIKFADVALYKAKELGRNRVVRFSKEMWSQSEY